jgi:hypothetical protein
MCEKPIANLILTPIQHSILEFLARAIIQGEEIKGLQIGKLESNYPYLEMT